MRSERHLLRPLQTLEGAMTFTRLPKTVQDSMPVPKGSPPPRLSNFHRKAAGAEYGAMRKPDEVVDLGALFVSEAPVGPWSCQRMSPASQYQQCR